MKKIFKRLIFISIISTLSYILIIFLAGYVGLQGVLPNAINHSGESYTTQKLIEVNKINKIDILFIGSSHVYRGFDPRIFNNAGFSSYNLGTPAQTPLNTYYLLKEYLPKIKPKYVILDLYWIVANNPGIESSIDLLSNMDLNSNSLSMAFHPKPEIKLIGCIISTYLLRLHKPISKAKLFHTKQEIYIQGGFTESLLIENKIDTEHLSKIPFQYASFSETQYSYLQEIIKYCHNSNAQLIFTLVPVTKEYKNKIINYKNYVNKINALAKKNKIPFTDYNSKNKLNLSSTADFLDRDHLSQTGVVKFNSLFIKDFLALNKLSSAQRP